VSDRLFLPQRKYIRGMMLPQVGESVILIKDYRDTYIYKKIIIMMCMVRNSL